MLNLLLESSNLLILVNLVLFSTSKFTFQGSNLLCKLGLLGVDLALALGKRIHLSLLSSNPVVAFIQLLLDISSHCLNPVGLVNNVLDGRATTLQSQLELILLVHEDIMSCLDLLPVSQSLVNVLLSNGNLFLILSLILSKLGALEIGLDGQPQLPPEPGLTNVVVPDGPLATVEGKLLVLHFLEDHTGSLTSSLRL